MSLRHGEVSIQPSSKHAFSFQLAKILKQKIMSSLLSGKKGFCHDELSISVRIWQDFTRALKLLRNYPDGFALFMALPI
ncbi:hypothetical protein Sjap_009410 [Stephania japonica]|uniref:Uncharacterized protein n=1 Tax=Stephania japonica TaxID=461633 RepID=A0AAP0JRB5_9MAGN